MKSHKEITLAVIIGLIFGLVVVGGVIRARKAIESMSLASPTPSPLASGEQPASLDSLSLEITTLDNQVVDSPEFQISGKTNPAGFVVILGEKGEHIVTPTETGTFSQEVTLVKGANTIKVTVYLENGIKVEKTLTAVYSASSI